MVFREALKEFRLRLAARKDPVAKRKLELIREIKRLSGARILHEKYYAMDINELQRERDLLKDFLNKHSPLFPENVAKRVVKDYVKRRKGSLYTFDPTPLAEHLDAIRILTNAKSAPLKQLFSLSDRISMRLALPGEEYYKRRKILEEIRKISHHKVPGWLATLSTDELEKIKNFLETLNRADMWAITRAVDPFKQPEVYLRLAKAVARGAPSICPEAGPEEKLPEFLPKSSKEVSQERKGRAEVEELPKVEKPEKVSLVATEEPSWKEEEKAASNTEIIKRYSELNNLLKRIELMKSNIKHKRITMPDGSKITLDVIRDLAHKIAEDENLYKHIKGELEKIVKLAEGGELEALRQMKGRGIAKPKPVSFKEVLAEVLKEAFQRDIEEGEHAWHAAMIVRKWGLGTRRGNVNDVVFYHWQREKLANALYELAERARKEAGPKKAYNRFVELVHEFLERNVGGTQSKEGWYELKYG